MLFAEPGHDQGANGGRPRYDKKRVYEALTGRLGRPAADLIGECNTYTHQGLPAGVDPKRFVRGIADLVRRVRELTKEAHPRHGHH